MSKISLFDINGLKKKLQSWSKEELCLSYSSFKSNGQLPAIEAKKAIIYELKSRDEKAFELWFKDNTNFMDPGAYFLKGAN